MKMYLVSFSPLLGPMGMYVADDPLAAIRLAVKSENKRRAEKRAELRRDRNLSQNDLDAHLQNAGNIAAADVISVEFRGLAEVAE